MTELPVRIISRDQTLGSSPAVLAPIAGFNGMLTWPDDLLKGNRSTKDTPVYEEVEEMLKVLWTSAQSFFGLRPKVLRTLAQSFFGLQTLDEENLDLDLEGSKRFQEPEEEKKYRSSSEESSNESSSEFSDSSSSSNSSSSFEAYSSSDKGFDKWKKKKHSTKKSKSASSKEDKSSKKASTSKGVSEGGLISKEKRGLDGKVDDLANQLKALSVHFAGLPSDRRKVPSNRAHVWCLRCKHLGHAPTECPIWHPQGQMVDEELGDQYGSSLDQHVEFFYEEAPNLVYQISAGSRNLHGRPTPSLARPADQNSGAEAASRLAMIYEKEGEEGTADETKKTKQEFSKSGVSSEQDSDYKRDHLKLFFPKINEKVKKQLQELETLEHAKALSNDLQIIRSRAAEEEEKVKVTPSEALISFDIKRDVKDCPVTATVGQMIKDNSLYRRQLKEMLARKQRRKGSGVNIMIEAIAYQLGFTQLEPTARTMRLANGARMFE
ncbi:hypothetical protein AXG93_402s1060 [Marchantia polymorpha subsp. ruderalis]|uniref:CCHC-type domain-containing protein n=1 Tax=Marchantia polymorpha subsp. ruderalis TaxID=1480154 RepID=A0A176WDG0_MARPO|nr:hypothetical protein AXG93_402s1060 [Marchantia polymorpha subsp. ruderalis]